LNNYKVKDINTSVLLSIISYDLMLVEL